MAADDPLKERFGILRRRARQAATQATQQEAEGLKRRFAQIGQVGSGAQIRAEAQAAKRGAERLARAEETVGLAELAERQRQQELGEARQFATREREAAQRFAAEQAGLGREFATAERTAQQQFAAQQAGIGREFAAQQADIQRKFQTGERLSAQDFASLEAMRGRKFSREEREAAQAFADAQAALARSFSAEQNELGRAMQQAGLDLQRVAFEEGVRRFDMEFARDSDTLAFNRRMAEDAASQTLWNDLGIPTQFGEDLAIGGISLAAGRRLLEGLGIGSGGFSVGGLF